MQSFRGNGAANAGDFIYGSISASPLERESLVGLQSKFLYMLSVLQSVEAQPTNAVVSGIEQLELRLKEMLTKWDTLK